MGSAPETPATRPLTLRGVTFHLPAAIGIPAEGSPLRRALERVAEKHPILQAHGMSTQVRFEHQPSRRRGFAVLPSGELSIEPTELERYSAEDMERIFLHESAHAMRHSAKKNETLIWLRSAAQSFGLLHDSCAGDPDAMAARIEEAFGTYGDFEARIKELRATMKLVLEGTAELAATHENDPARLADSFSRDPNIDYFLLVETAHLSALQKSLVGAVHQTGAAPPAPAVKTEAQKVIAQRLKRLDAEILAPAAREEGRITELNRLFRHADEFSADDYVVAYSKGALSMVPALGIFSQVAPTHETNTHPSIADRIGRQNWKLKIVQSGKEVWAPTREQEAHDHSVLRRMLGRLPHPGGTVLGLS